MCGPSGSEKALEASSQSFASMLQQNYGTLFSGMTDALKSIGTAISPIVAAGPGQRGFTGAEMAALQTEAITSSAAAARSAEQAARTFGAGQGGGGTSGLTSGVQQQIEAGIASQGAQAEATRLGQIEQADWATGRENYFKALGAQQQLAGTYAGATGGAQGGAIGEGQAAFGEAAQIQQQQEQMARDIAGGVTSLAENVVLPGLGAVGQGNSFFSAFTGKDKRIQ